MFFSLVIFDPLLLP